MWKASSLLDVTVYETADNSVAADCEHVEFSPDNFAIGIGFQVALNCVPNLLFRIELSDFAGSVVAFDEHTITDTGTSWNFDGLIFALTKDGKQFRADN